MYHPRHGKRADDRQRSYVFFNKSFAIEMLDNGRVPRAHFRDVREGGPDEEFDVGGHARIGDGDALRYFDFCRGLFPDLKFPKSAGRLEIE
jgi:hypothetical protein